MKKKPKNCNIIYKKRYIKLLRNKFLLKLYLSFIFII